jgi:hypothetical protein
MVFQAVRTRFPLRIAAGMTELGLLQEPLYLYIKGHDLSKPIYPKSFSLDTASATQYVKQRFYMQKFQVNTSASKVLASAISRKR